LGLATISTHGTVPAVTAKLPYDPIADFTPIANAVTVPSVMVINGKLGPKNMKEFIALLKSAPGKYSFGSSGIGSGAHLDGELFKQVSGTFMVHIPYRGSSSATNDLLAGQIAAQYDALSSVLPYIKSGQLVALAVASNSRIPELPDVPTYNEVGLSVLNNPAWWGIVGPAKIPADIADRLNALIAESLHEPAVEAQLRRIGASVQTESRQSFSARIQRELVLRKEIATNRKIVVD
jgi:tripartite-type tricarboxylate transporter receptor subunit TctC